MKDPANEQRKHYDRFAEEYSHHYDDLTSQEYRNRFIYDRLFKGVDLSNALILDAMCGTGGLAGYLGGRRVLTVGFDISYRELILYKKSNTTGAAVHASAFDPCFSDASVDGIVIIGGLHHLQPRVNDAFKTFHRILKANGAIYFCEPHQGSLPDFFRRIWYRFDPLFLSNESSIDLKMIMEENKDLYRFKTIGFYGNLAYLFILNSMVFRLNSYIKQRIASPLFALESLLSPLQTHLFSCFVLGKAEKI